MMQSTDRRQRGATLLVVMVILIAMTWFALSGYRLSSQHLQIVGNSQARQQALAAAQRAIEETISSNLFTVNPAAIAAAPIATDIDGDGTPDFTAMLTPQPKCYRVHIIKTSELDISSSADRVCLRSAGGGGGVVVAQPGFLPSVTGNSSCANTEWNVAARVDDARSGSSLTVQQGVAIRSEAVNASNFCK
jgi:type II secretory pathway pseudopilin PulG